MKRGRMKDGNGGRMKDKTKIENIKKEEMKEGENKRKEQKKGMSEVWIMHFH